MIKEIKMFETCGFKFETYEAAERYEEIEEICKIFNLTSRYKEISIDRLIDNKDKLIQFFIDKGYVNKKEK